MVHVCHSFPSYVISLRQAKCLTQYIWPVHDRACLPGENTHTHTHTQCKGYELSLFSVLLRTVAWETASQLAPRSSPEE